MARSYNGSIQDGDLGGVWFDSHKGRYEQDGTNSDVQ